jgi:hypothetical protein
MPSSGFVRIVQRETQGMTQTPTASADEIVLEVGAARIRVRCGFNSELLASIVSSLSGGTQ